MVVGVFVVDRHQRPVFVAGEFEQAHAVVIVAELHFLCAGCSIAAWIERRCIFLQRLAPTDQYRGFVARRQGDGVGRGGGDAFKAQQPAVAFAHGGG
ncbi:hypothetical protein D3C84_1139480 [compost metagenome]